MAPWRSRRMNAPLTLEIKPDREYILVRGSIAETRNSKIRVSGHVVVRNSEECFAKHGIHLKSWGRIQIHHCSTRLKESDPTPPSVLNGEQFLPLEQELLDPATGTTVRVIKQGETVLPYTFELPGDLSESIVGLGKTGVVYEMQASLEKSTAKVLDFEYSSKKIRTNKQFRVVRTLSENAHEELYDRAETVGTWEPKCTYKFGSTARAVPFGGQISNDFQLTKLDPKLAIGKIKLTLRERRKLKTWAPEPEKYDRQHDSQHGWWVREYDICSQTFKLSPQDLVIDATTQAEMYLARHEFQLPTGLDKCRQTIVDHPNIRLKHTLHYQIEIINADGHISLINAHHVIRIFISEHRPIDGNDCAQPESSRINEPTQNTLEEAQQPPPLYDRHYLDQMFSDTTAIGAYTPGNQSGANTPGFSNSSRSNSYGNLAGLTSSQEPLPEDLSERLAAAQLNMNRGEYEHGGLQSANASPGPSRTNSVGWNMDALSRTVSYGTAVASRQSGPSEQGPPSYEDATSRPPSPGGGAR